MKGEKMVDGKIIDDTIKRMLEAEIDDSTIISTLKDVGLDEVTAREKINAVRKLSAEPEEDVGAIESQIDDSAKIESLQNEVSVAKETTQLHESTTHNMLNAHEQKIDDVAKKMDDVHKSVQQTAEKINSPNESTSAKLAEVAASQKAIMKLLNDVLEVNRKVLTELQMKK
jgi:hypothetical protein